MKRKIALAALVACTALGLSIHPGAIAQDKFPTKPIQLVVPFPPGGVADIVARAMSPVLEKGLAQPVVVINKPGAGGALGTGTVTTSKPDGYTLLLALASVSTNPEQERLNKRPSVYHNWVMRKRIPVVHVPAVERVCGVRVEELAPEYTWLRLPDPTWPNKQGRPLLDLGLELCRPRLRHPPDARKRSRLADGHQAQLG